MVIVVAGLRFYYDFIFFFSIRQLPSELAERNSAKINDMLRSECDLIAYVRYLGYPIPVKIGGAKPTFFRRLRNVTTILTAYVFGKQKTDIIGQVR